CGQGTNVPYTF
nr:immunoglobulin light chain junction region [Macaca mulatta]MOW09099.1 immunoglobulin light chain junction region [Macaca mulatta]MOW12110.1 immunoglobulin light chain junction region [Macaca mulatta]MOW13209.1 immunoglobulin light chain junction region [Macaca mulatta]MOW13303.1 immunoglobulin light chain junction region [Macaca mulatta]